MATDLGVWGQQNLLVVFSTWIMRHSLSLQLICELQNPQPGTYTVTQVNIKFPGVSLTYRADAAQADQNAPPQVIKPWRDEMQLEVMARIPQKGTRSTMLKRDRH